MRYILPILLILPISWYVWSTVGTVSQPTRSANVEVADGIPSTPADATPDENIPPIGGDGAEVLPVHIPILVYHGVRDTTPDEAADVRQFNIRPVMLEKQIKHLIEHGYTPIPMSLLASHFDQGTPLPEKPVVLTFDDGWRSQYVHGLPILRAHEVTATFYLFPNALGHNTFMSWDEVRELVDAGMEIGSHSLSHQYMTQQEPARIIKEIIESKEWLEEKLETPVSSFAYPYGLHNEHIVALVEEHGYHTARDLTHTVIHTPLTRFTLGAYLITNNFDNFTYILSLASRAPEE